MCNSKCEGYKVEEMINKSSIPKEHTPYTRVDLYKNGVLHQSRWFDKNGLPIRNRDYTEHGNSTRHPIVPHDHLWKNGVRDTIAIEPDYRWR